MKNYKAVGNMVLMRPRVIIKLERDEASGLGIKGGILIPEGAATGPAPGTNPMTEFRVISAGPDCKVVKERDIVLVNGHIAMKIPLDDKQEDVIVLVAETSIIAVVEEVSDAVASPSS
jgi:predicted aconitase with swiveling domain